jgi:choline dehydrogenase
VRLNGHDPRTPLAIEHGFLSDETDVEVLVDALETLRELMSTDALGRYAGENIRPGDTADLEHHARQSVRGYFHPVGTCALGSVVDETGAVLGHEGLYVADASVMPTIPRANTNLSTLAVAEKIAAGLGS